MSKKCPSCGADCPEVFQCDDCRHMFCKWCGNYAFVRGGPISAYGCPECRGTQTKVSRDDDDHETVQNTYESDDLEASSQFNFSSGSYSDFDPVSNPSSYSSSQGSFSGTSPNSDLLFTIMFAGIWFVVSYVIASILGFLFPIWRIVLFRILLSNWFYDVSDATLVRWIDIVLNLIVYGGSILIVLMGISRYARTK